MADGPDRPIYLPAPYEGYDTSVAPHQLRENRASYLKNFLVHEDYRLPLRGPVRWTAITGQDTDEDNTAIEDTYTRMHPTPIEGSLLYQPIKTLMDNVARWPIWRTFDPLAPDYAWANRQGVAKSGVFDPAALHVVVAGTGTAATVGPQSVALLGQVYTMGIRDRAGPNFTGMRISYSGKYHGVNTLHRYGPRPGDTVITPAGANAEQGPRATVALAAYTNRLWAGGGIAPNAAADTVNGGGGTQQDDLTNKTLTPNTLYFTNDGAEPTSGIAAWQTSGVTNNIVVGSETSSDHIVALASNDRFLLIMKRYSTWVLTGNSVDSFTLRRLSATEGCIDPRAVAVINDSIYFLGPRGLMRYDGVELAQVSRAVNRELLPAIATYGTPAAPRDALNYVEVLPEGYLLIHVGTHALDNAEGSSTISGFAALYDTAHDRWSLFQAQVFDNQFCPAAVGTVTDRYFGLDGEDVFEMTNVVTPLSAPADERGYDLAETGKALFVAQVTFAPVRGSSPNQRLKIPRYGAEYYFQQAPGTTDSGRLVIRLLRYINQDNQDASDAITGELPLPAFRYAFGGVPDRPSIKWFKLGAEATDVVVHITRETSGSAFDDLDRGELLGVLLEVQTPTMRRT